MKRRAVYYLIILLSALSVAIAARAATTFFSSYVAGTGFVQAVDEVRVTGADIIGTTTLQVTVAPVSGATVSGATYTVRVKLDSGVSSSATASWTTQQINAGTAQAVQVAGLTSLVSANSWIITVTR